ncbi:MAG: hypothetical protein ACR2GY_01820 [Phycisphaerales bacterium]
MKILDNAAAPDADIASAVLAVQPRTANQLHAVIRLGLGFDVPRVAMVPGHAAPFDYVAHAFFEEQHPGLRDCVVWANRGGGKTQLGAIVTLLELLHKPGIQIRILAGSFEQSSKMYASLKQLIERDVLIDQVQGRITGRGFSLRSGSRVEVLSQSECSIRGQRVHKLRCDEVELFDRDIWQAAQMVTRSGRCGNTFVHGCVEAISTMHRPYGLMHELIDDASKGLRKLFQWNVIDVLERCPPERACETCTLFDACGSAAKHATGFMHIDDVIAQKMRIGEEVWQSEMLCRQPSMSGLVYPTFEMVKHVLSGEDARALVSGQKQRGIDGEWIGGVDFGLRAPTVFLWAWHNWSDDTVVVVDEYVAIEKTTHEHLRDIAQAPWPQPAWIGADPAGHQRSEQSGRSTISLWRENGWRVRTHRHRLDAGIETVKARLVRGDGTIGLRIARSCETLIRSLAQYHYPADAASDDDRIQPVKDGNDHAADALRYMLMCLDGAAGSVIARGY